jgi:hypothetical protein
MSESLVIEQRRMSTIPETALVLHLLNLVLASSMAVVTKRPFVLLSAAFFIGCGTLAVRALAKKADRAFLSALFAASVTIRMIAAGIEYFLSESVGVRMFDRDALTYWITSQSPLDQIIIPNDLGYVVYNRLMTVVGSFVGGSHFLANLQLEIVCGALAGPLAWCLCDAMRQRALAKPVSVLVAFHPAMIAYSATLIRDEVVFAFGFSALVLAVRALDRRFAFRLWALIAALILVVFNVREASAMYFVAVILFFALLSRARRKTVVRIFVYGGLAVMFTVILLRTHSFTYMFGSQRLNRQIEWRNEEAAVQGSLATAVVNRSFAQWVVVGTALNFVAPIPFFWNLIQEPAALDWLTAAAGALNQLLLVFFFIGGWLAWKQRQRLLVAALIATLGFSVLSAYVMGDPLRYMSSHTYPFEAVLVMYGMRMVKRNAVIIQLSWMAMLIVVYGAYLVLKGVL